MTMRQSLVRLVGSVLPQPVRFELRRVAYRGSARRCPLCGNRVRTFIDHGGDADVLKKRKVVGGMWRRNDACPVCRGADRTRLLLLCLKSLILADGKPRRILHIAPEMGLYLTLKSLSGVDYVAADLDLERYRHIKGVVKADLTDLPFETASFDVVICSHVLEHVPDDRKAMSEILRVLRTTGAALLMVPLATDGQGTDEDPSVTTPEERDRRFGQWDHLRLYGQDDFAARLKRVGFDVAWFDGFSQFPEEARDLWLNPAENLALARPRP